MDRTLFYLVCGLWTSPCNQSVGNAQQFVCSPGFSISNQYKVCKAIGSIRKWLEDQKYCPRLFSLVGRQCEEMKNIQRAFRFSFGRAKKFGVKKKKDLFGGSRARGAGRYE